MSRARLIGGVLLALAGVPGWCLAGAPPPSAAAPSLPDIVAPLMPAVVNITVLKQPSEMEVKGAQDMPPPQQAQGSGFIIDPAGYIVTNRHVIAGAYQVTVVMSDAATYPAQVLSTNERPDLALLKIDTGYRLPIVIFGDSDALRIGETVIAIGNPLGLSSSVSMGVVSALNRDIDATMIDDFIQTDAAINHGNSGGPLFDLQGRVIGINWALLSQGSSSSAGLGLAIPSNDAAWVIDQMRRFGRLHAGFAGLRLQQVTPDMAKVLGLPRTEGSIVSGTWPDGPAARAGLQPEDVVLSVGGRFPRDVRELLRMLGATPPGASVAVTYWRDGVEHAVNLTLANWPSSDYDPAGAPVMPDRGRRTQTADLGLRLGPADASARRALSLASSDQAVSVLGVAANSPAADAGLAEGDVILRVGNTPVQSADDVMKQLDQARIAGKGAVLMLVMTQSRSHWVVVPVGPT